MSDSKITFRRYFRRASMCFRHLILGIFLLGAFQLYGQQKHWYYFSDQLTQEGSKALLEAAQLRPVVWSDWYHAWSAEGESACEISGLDSIRLVSPIKILSSDLYSPIFGFALEQINGEAILNEGLSGKGVKIGIIDGGFLGADQSKSLSTIIEGGRLKAFHNYLQPEDTVPYNGSHALDDEHGTEVWELTGGFSREKNIQFGLATGADYFLARTDHGSREEKQEEDFLVAALEWMDSMNVRLVNISLGYNNTFDNPGDNYTQQMMDGKTSLASLACQKATDEKGMLIVVAAGNDGNNAWQIVDVPADAPGVLSVGATDLKYWRKMPFSSIGTDFTSFLKPEISCFASSGTSFSAPIITGLAACLWEKAPSLSNQEIKALILQSGHLAGSPNNYLGHGVPDAQWLLEKLRQSAAVDTVSRLNNTIPARKKKSIVLEGGNKKQVVLYHKKDQFHVIKEEYFTISSTRLLVKQHQQASFTTVVVDHTQVMEIEWK